MSENPGEEERWLRLKDMATPIGHALAGYGVYAFSGEIHERNRRRLFLLCIAVAIVPDLDILPGLLMGQPAFYHQGITHSFGFAFLVSLVVASLFRSRDMSFYVLFKICFIAYGSHLVIDFFGPDNRLPYGEPLLWPPSGEYFISPVRLFLGVHHAASTSASAREWIDGLLSIYNLGAIIVEIAIIAPMVFVCQRLRKRRLSPLEATFR